MNNIICSIVCIVSGGCHSYSDNNNNTTKQNYSNHNSCGNNNYNKIDRIANIFLLLSYMYRLLKFKYFSIFIIVMVFIRGII